MFVVTLPFSMRALRSLTDGDRLAVIATAELISWLTALIPADNILKTSDGGVLGRDATADLRAAVTAEINKRIPARS